MEAMAPIQVVSTLCLVDIRGRGLVNYRGHTQSFGKLICMMTALGWLKLLAQIRVGTVNIISCKPQAIT
jgi:hypothetical protein